MRVLTTCTIIAGMCLAIPRLAQATIVEFTLDSGRSGLSAGGPLAASNSPAGALPQSAGADQATFSGKIRVDLTENSIQLLTGSIARASLQPTDLQPAFNGGLGGAPANYGLTAAAGPLGTPSAAVRELEFLFISDAIPLSAGRFQNDVHLRASSGRIDYQLGNIAGAKDFSGLELPADDDPLGSLLSDGATQTLTLPFYTSLVFSVAESNDSAVILTGELVATRQVPEPSGGILALGLAACLLRRRRYALISVSSLSLAKSPSL